jgi:hypothetical protein
VDGAGGDGGPGLVQLHVPLADEPFANLRLPVGTSLAELSEPLPVGAASGAQMLPTFETHGQAPLFQAVARRSLALDLRLWRSLPLRID